MLSHGITPNMIKHRYRYEVNFKMKVIRRLEELKMLHPELANVARPGFQKLVAAEFKIHPSLVSKWYDSSLDFEFQGVNSKLKSICTVHMEDFPTEEAMLLDAVYVRRQLFGLWVDKYWLEDELYCIMEETKPAGWETFACSSGWISGFCKRNRITKQARTNKKDVPILVKQDQLKVFHRQMLEMHKSRAEAGRGGGPFSLKIGRIFIVSKQQRQLV